MKLSLRSFTDRAEWYEVDTDSGKCSCMAFQGDGWCKHLESVGQYKPKTVTLSARPSYSQALSGLVKSIRIRNIDEGAYWLNYCWSFRERLSGSQYRTVRRLLIGSAEDGHSVAVMEKVAENFDALLAKNVEFPRVMAEFLRICKIPNWWKPETGGHDYIRCGMVAARRTLYDQQPYALNHCLSSMAQAVEDQDKTAALFWILKGCDAGKGSGLSLANRLHEIAVARNHDSSARLMKNVHLRHAKALHDDNNFLGQAAWLLAGGECPVVDRIEVVTHGEVRRILDKVNSTALHVIPGWCCDGVHCAGADIRYCGTWDRMFAVCQQYNHYQRVSPDDPWIEDQFYQLEGLDVRQ